MVFEENKGKREGTRKEATIVVFSCVFFFSGAFLLFLCDFRVLFLCCSWCFRSRARKSLLRRSLLAWTSHMKQTMKVYHPSIEG